MKFDFKSIFSCELKNYVNHRINNGFGESAHYYLIQFDNFLSGKNIKNKTITKEIMDEWALKKDTESKNSRNSRVTAVRQFNMYLNSIGIEAYIPNYHFSTTKKVPYVLDEKELIQLFKVLDEHYSVYDFTSTYHYRFMIPVFFRLLYTCGLRNNEACQLMVNDIDHKHKTIFIKNAKNKKDRIVYLSDDMYDLLIEYLDIRIRYIKSSFIFPSRDPDKSVMKTSICKFFHQIVLEANIGSADHYPTPHSLRHTYVVNLIDSWVNNSNSVENLIPYLSKQLGHSSIEETFYYYHMLDTSYRSILSKDRNLLPEVSVYEEE